MTKNTGLSDKKIQIESKNRYQSATLNDIKQKDLVAYCIEWMAEPQLKPSPFITGIVGIGKTHFLHALRKQLWKTIDLIRSDIMLHTEADLIFEIKNGIATNTSGMVVDKFKNVKILLLDDLGGPHKVTDWTLEQIYLIIDFRWNRCLPTVVTSNHSFEGLSRILGERIVSRLAGLTKSFVLRGKDRRLEI